MCVTLAWSAPIEKSSALNPAMSGKIRICRLKLDMLDPPGKRASGVNGIAMRRGSQAVGHPGTQGTVLSVLSGSILSGLPEEASLSINKSACRLAVGVYWIATGDPNRTPWLDKEATCAVLRSVYAEVWCWVCAGLWHSM